MPSDNRTILERLNGNLGAVLRLVALVTMMVTMVASAVTVVDKLEHKIDSNAYIAGVERDKLSTKLERNSCQINQKIDLDLYTEHMNGIRSELKHSIVSLQNEISHLRNEQGIKMDTLSCTQQKILDKVDTLSSVMK